MIENEWTYYVNTNERIAKIIPIEDQVPGNNANNTEFTLKTTQISFYETDHLGNTRIVFSPEKFNGDGSVDRKIHLAADYYPYGKTLRYFETSTFEEKYLTTQHERDRETGFDYRHARFYDSEIGRFLSLDPLSAEFPAWSAYNYVMGNPIMLIDPDGKIPTRPGENDGEVAQDEKGDTYIWSERYDESTNEIAGYGWVYVGQETEVTPSTITLFNSKKLNDEEKESLISYINDMSKKSSEKTKDEPFWSNWPEFMHPGGMEGERWFNNAAEPVKKVVKSAGQLAIELYLWSLKTVPIIVTPVDESLNPKVI